MMKSDPGIFLQTAGQELLVEGKPGRHLATGKDEPAWEQSQQKAELQGRERRMPGHINLTCIFTLV